MVPSKTILLADDDPSLLALLETILTDAGYRVVPVADGKAAMAALSRGGVDLVLSDIRMPHADGMAVLRAAARRQPAPPVILLTAFGTIEGAVDAMRGGAFDYMTKPLESPAALRTLVARALADTPGSEEPTAPMTGIFVDPASKQLLRLVELVAGRDTTVLILGESGVGKEVVARLVHDRSQRRSGAFVALNCAAIPTGLAESQLFGHKRGAFTGAEADHPGAFVQADGGTLFLDEVGELSGADQARLLRVLQERTLRPVGAVEDVTVDVRVIAATHRNLRADMDAGRFRRDLYYRLSVFPVPVPPLRERPADIAPLAEASAREAGHGHPLSGAVIAALQAHAWPGNVRELRNAIERASILAGDGPILTTHFEEIAQTPARRRRRPGNTGKASLKDLERKAIAAALDAAGGNRKEAAKALGIALRTLQYKLKAYGLTRR